MKGTTRPADVARAWLTGGALAGAGMFAITLTVPAAPPGRFLSSGQETLHVHAPWTVVATFAALAAALVWRGPYRWLVAAVPPVALALAVTAAGWPDGVPAFFLPLEAAFGAAIGRILAGTLTARPGLADGRGAAPGWRSVHEPRLPAARPEPDR